MLFRRPRAGDDSAAARIHRAHTDRLWHQTGPRTSWSLLTAIAGWPAYIVATMIRATWLNGATGSKLAPAFFLVAAALVTLGAIAASSAGPTGAALADE